jgi:hypothetical protein
MNLIRWLIKTVEIHKDFLVTVAALLSPFAAVWAAIIASKRASEGVIQSARIQTQADVVTAYRQRLIDTLRTELAAQIDYISYFRVLRQESPTRWEEMTKVTMAGDARSTRIALLSGMDSLEAKEFFSLSKKLVMKTQSAPREKQWTDEETAAFETELNELAHIAIELVSAELERARSIET